MGRVAKAKTRPPKPCSCAVCALLLHYVGSTSTDLSGDLDTMDPRRLESGDSWRAVNEMWDAYRRNQ